MKTRVVASTKVGYELPIEEAIKFSGKEAGICYMPDSFDAILSEAPEKTIKRAEGNLKNRHHSVFEHAHYNFVLEGIPKILAMVLNNEGVYVTSEKSARYTRMEPSPKEKELYDKWLEKFQSLISAEYGKKYLKYYGDEKKAATAIKKIAQENARYLISVFTNTTMAYTVSFRQLSYIVSFFKRFIADEEEEEDEE